MNPWVLAFSVITPSAFLAGFLIRPFIAPGKSSTPAGQPLTPKDIAMAVYAELTQPLADLDAAVAGLPDRVAAAVAKGDPAAVQDKADTLAAVETSLSDAVTAINAVGGA